MFARSMTPRLLKGGALVAALAVFTGCESGDEADLVLRNGNIVTVDDANPRAQALAAKDGRIVALGSDADIEQYIGSNTQVIDLDGMTAIPGLIEGHGHFMGVGDANLQLKLMEVANWGEIVAMVEEAVAQADPGELIRGRGWHQEKWDEVVEGSVEGVPTHHSLSAVSPDNPVILRHASGHATFANAKAMEMAGIGADTRSPSGGEIVRDASGNPTGYLKESAGGLLGPAQQGAVAPDPRRVVQLGQEEALAKGLTSFQDAGSGFNTIDVFREMAEDGSLKIRLWVMIRASNEELAEKLPDYKITGAGDDRLTVRAIKRSIDGALGSHGAWLLEPYNDLPESSGLPRDIEGIYETAELAIQHGFQLGVHAIGDRGNRVVFDIFEETFEKHPDQQDVRWRIEHAQHLHPDDIPRFGNLKVVASMQGVHATSDGPWVEPRLGAERAEWGAYVWQDIMKAGGMVTNGTDAPVEDVDPLASFYTTVSRRMNNGEVFYPEQRMSRMEALKSYTINVAYSGYEEDIKGSLEVGKLADVTVLTKDIMTIPENEILSTQVAYTIVGGVVMYTGATN